MKNMISRRNFLAVAGAAAATAALHAAVLPTALLLPPLPQLLVPLLPATPSRSALWAP